MNPASGEQWKRASAAASSGVLNLGSGSGTSQLFRYQIQYLDNGSPVRNNFV